jgi:hypothetical protein
MLGLSVSKPVAYDWAARVTVSPTAVSVPRGSSASVAYSVQYVRTPRAAGYLLAGSLRIVNPTSSPLPLTKVTVEVPRPAGAAAAWARPSCPLDDAGATKPVPARGNVSCAFSLPYVSAVAAATLVARVVAPGWPEVASAPAAFSTANAARQVLGACALASDTFERPDAANPTLLAPAALNAAPLTGSKAPEMPGGKLLCASAAFAYSARIGPVSSTMACGDFKARSTHVHCGACWGRGGAPKGHPGDLREMGARAAEPSPLTARGLPA